MIQVRIVCYSKVLARAQYKTAVIVQKCSLLKKKPEMVTAKLRAL